MFRGIINGRQLFVNNCDKHPGFLNLSKAKADEEFSGSIYLFNSF